ncbi:CU044_5270 family protein [Salinibacterium sp. PAMC 21357]|uniref:CU044_5270 family protein n=1 Tax=Salinibacterium sp. PAMC 21357 TaxID=1112215 RepID=UPI00028913AD|nr:CU044_5270 family protein [Salinibacterium sp. PAMC 21357]
MDELQLLRSFGKNVADPSVDALSRGRRGLVEHIGLQPAIAKPNSKKRFAFFGGTTALAAGALVATLVFTDVLGLAGWRGGADAAAASALSDAAAAAIENSDPVVGPGQYLKIDTEAVFTGGVQTAEWEHFAYLGTQDSQMYIPADDADDWVLVTEPRAAIKVFGEGFEEEAQESARAGFEEEQISRAPYGSFDNSKPRDWRLDDLPRDPQQLLNYIYRVTAGHGVSADGQAFDFISTTLRTGVVPAELRAALYLAAAGIPGVEITDEAATLNGRTGVAFGREEKDGFLHEIIIDPETGLLIGERTVQLFDSKMDLVFAGEVVGWTAVTTTVVDAAPAGGSLCGNGGEPVNGFGSGQCSDPNRPRTD